MVAHTRRKGTNLYIKPTFLKFAIAVFEDLWFNINCIVMCERRRYFG